MTKFRLVAASAAVGIIAATGVVGGTAQAHAAPINTGQVASAAGDITMGAFNSWFCKKFRLAGPACP